MAINLLPIAGQSNGGHCHHVVTAPMDITAAVGVPEKRGNLVQNSRRSAFLLCTCIFVFSCFKVCWCDLEQHLSQWSLTVQHCIGLFILIGFSVFGIFLVNHR